LTKNKLGGKHGITLYSNDRAPLISK